MIASQGKDDGPKIEKGEQRENTPAHSHCWFGEHVH